MCCEEDRDEGEEIGGSGEGLCGQRVMAHVCEDLGEKDGKGGVGHVCEHEHCGGDPSDRVDQNGEDLANLETGRGFGRRRRGLVAETKAGDLALAACEVGGCLGGVWDDGPGDDGDDDGGEPFNEE